MEPEIAARGARLAFVGNGTPAHARDFRAQFAVRVPLYVDPSEALYRTLGFAHGVGATFAPGAALAAARAFAAGHRQGAVQGDPFQQGGAALVRPDGTVPWVFRSAHAGDHPTPAALRRALDGV